MKNYNSQVSCTGYIFVPGSIRKVFLSLLHNLPLCSRNTFEDIFASMFLCKSCISYVTSSLGPDTEFSSLCGLYNLCPQGKLTAVTPRNPWTVTYE